MVYVQVIYQHQPGGTEKTHETPQTDRQISKQGPSRSVNHSTGAFGRYRLKIKSFNSTICINLFIQLVACILIDCGLLDCDAM